MTRRNQIGLVIIVGKRSDLHMLERSDNITLGRLRGKQKNDMIVWASP